MNDRIRDLAEAATIQEGSHGAFGEPTINEYVDLEKFAELIVAECEKVVYATISESIDHERHLDETGSWIVSDIRKHFGVDQ